MTIEEAIEIRRSRRKYLNKPIEPHIAAKLRGLADEYSKTSGIRIELVFNNGTAFNGFRKSYGMFSGVNDYAVLIADKRDKASVEKLGYYGELLLLHAVMNGLGTCWVGGSFNRSDINAVLSDSEEFICAITVGQTDDKDSLKERLVRSMTHRKTKSVTDMYESDADVPEWFIHGMEAVAKAPSAVNRQPVVFSYKSGSVTAAVAKYNEAMYALDFGIAKLHFENGSGGGIWEWGNNGRFERINE